MNHTRQLLAAAAFFVATLPALAQPPRVFLLDANQLASIKAAPASDVRKQQVVKAATAAADKAITEGPFSVMQKGVTPPSGDKHDYMSQAPYFWADPSKPNGLPYIRRDGEHNPEIKKITDHDQLGRLGEDSRNLALAWYLTGNAAYADRAALLIRTWFLVPATRMNPNLEFGQGIPGINTGRGIGLIETRSLMPIADAAGLLAGSPAWTAADQKGLTDWYAAFLKWMLDSQKGRDEDAAKNNHGTWYDLQVTDYALFLGRRDLAVETLTRAKLRRIAFQIEPDGRQPLELARTNGWGYSIGNLDGLMQLAWLGQQAGVDLWGFRTADGRSIRAALDFLIPYSEGKPWDYQQIGGFHADALLGCLQQAANFYHDPKYVQFAQQLASGHNDPVTVLRRVSLSAAADN
ncbi:alginate lyase family protein [Edaphobacter flagellatus]|uniref:alginate lyase family protein n=1 Tax=Edaphobacter flagellatus TaxID=1933044 RepID=UPI0021B1785B|nr:alginate lyase family protein [Edaphobacter flagellatus]